MAAPQGKDWFINMHNYFVYKLFSLLFKWSLVYFLVLILLEDLKPTIVTSHFSPHWFLLLALIMGLLLFFFPQADMLNKQRPEWRWFDYLLVIAVGIVATVVVGVSLDGSNIGKWFISLVAGMFVALISFQLARRI